MALADIGLFDLAERRLAWLDQRQGLLAQNIANADTPAWRERDLKPFAASLARATILGGPTRTNPLHLAGTQDAALSLTPRPVERAPDGNTVQIDRELTKVADTDANQELVSDLYHKYMTMFKTALGR